MKTELSLVYVSKIKQSLTLNDFRNIVDLQSQVISQNLLVSLFAQLCFLGTANRVQRTELVLKYAGMKLLDINFTSIKYQN
jgi:hypothetical protein